MHGFLNGGGAMYNEFSNISKLVHPHKHRCDRAPTHAPLAMPPATAPASRGTTGACSCIDLRFFVSLVACLFAARIA